MIASILKWQHRHYLIAAVFDDRWLHVGRRVSGIPRTPNWM
jgi:hypothetical protein